MNNSFFVHSSSSTSETLRNEVIGADLQNDAVMESLDQPSQPEIIQTTNVAPNQPSHLEISQLGMLLRLSTFNFTDF